MPGIQSSKVRPSPIPAVPGASRRDRAAARLDLRRLKLRPAPLVPRDNGTVPTSATFR